MRTWPALPSDRADAELTGQIREVHEESRGRYGAPRIHAELRRRGPGHEAADCDRRLRIDRVRR
jgi:hypothetical protein